MKKLLSGIILIGLLIVFCLFGFGQEIALDKETQPTSTLVFGSRLQSNMAFYLQAGVMMGSFDFMAGLGWNNSIWLGAHKYFYSTEEFAAFSGIELHIRYPEEETIEFHPCLPIGFAVTADQATFIIQTLIYPSLEGEPITALFGISFLFDI